MISGYVFASLQEVGAYVVRVSFGTALVASIVIVYTTIISILSSSRYVCYCKTDLGVNKLLLFYFHV
jgi:hypothetical protein